MPEEATTDPQETEDTPTQEVEETPNEDSSTTPVIDWEKRYYDTRSFSDQRFNEQATELKQYQDQLAAIREAQRQPEYDEPEYDEEDFADPVARQHIARLEAQLAEQQQQDTLAREQAHANAHIDAEFDAIEAETGDEISDAEAQMLAQYAIANRDEHGRPDVRLAYQTYTEQLEGRKSKWVDKKKSAATPAAGPGAVEVPDLTDRKARIDYINEQMRQREQ